LKKEDSSAAGRSRPRKRIHQLPTKLKKEGQLQGEVNERKRFIGSKEEEDSSTVEERRGFIDYRRS
jgi:hypothetical protein